MARDHYEVLGVPENATEPWIRRAYQTAQERIAADAGLSDADRAAAVGELESAFRTLTSSSARDAYDDKLRRAREAQGNGAGGLMDRLKSPTTWIAIGLVIVIGGGWYWQHAREQAQLRAEQERVASEQAEQRRMVEVEERRKREKQRLLDEIRAQKEAEENQHQLSMEARQADMQKKQFVADDRYIAPQQQQLNNFADRTDAWRRQSEEQRQRYEEEMNLRRAQAEVERQRRYLEQKEREEQYERARKDPNNINRRYEGYR
jgi:hypothetical protein